MNTAPPTSTVHLVLGLLGAGKTTLLQHVLGVADGRARPALLVGELADIDFDAEALRSRGAEVRRVTSDGDWVTPLRALVEAGHRRIVVETSGATDAAQLVTALREDADLAERVRWGRVVTLVDGPLLPRLEREFAAALSAQLRAADLVVVNKRDRLDDDAEAAAVATVARHNPAAEVRLAFMGQVPAAAFYAERPAGPLPAGLTGALPADLDAYVYRTRRPCYDRARLGHALLHPPAGHVLRVKGRVRAWDGAYDVTAVPGQLDWLPVEEGAAPTDETVLAFIGTGFRAGADAVKAWVDAELMRQGAPPDR